MAGHCHGEAERPRRCHSRSPRLARRIMRNETSSSGATRQCRAAASTHFDVRDCPSLKRPFRLARNCRNHTEPSEPAATSVGRRAARQVECLPTPSAATATAGRRSAASPTRRHRPSLRSDGSAPRGLDLVAGKNSVFQPGDAIAGQVGKPGGPSGAIVSRPRRAIGVSSTNRSTSPALLTRVMARAARSVNQALPSAATASRSGSMLRSIPADARRGRRAIDASHRHGRW